MIDNIKNNLTTVIIVFLGLLLCSLSILLLVFNTNIKNFSKRTTWNVKITNIKTINISSEDRNKYIPEVMSDSSVKFGTQLLNKKDSITYVITVENNGTIDAYLKNIIVDNFNDSNIDYKIQSDKILKSDESTNITIKLYKKTNKKIEEKDYLVTVLYEQLRT